MPHRIGMEPIFSDWWDPIIAACAETDTVDLPARRLDRRRRHAAGRADGAARRDAVRPALARPRARSGCGRATRCSYPDLKITMSEGGIGWVAMLHDRLENIVDRSGYGRLLPRDLRPGRGAAPQLLVLHDRRPVDAQHARHDRRRPHHVRDRLPARRRHLARHARRVVEKFWGHLPAEESRKITHENAAELFRHPLPPVCLP